VEEVAITRLQLYPNPVSNVLTVHGNTSIIENIIIYALTGQKILQINKHFNEIDVSKLEAGVYFIKLVAANRQRHIKFIKE
ncbi:MAG: T9SS type A sorting domain-containing protein, partial [Winogradskyella sp.]|uniref:T9SS type A sorting domain-containing protein n=1 Tax=Winogradskyella sp. TaxID=1883156 RepID=UPI0017AC7745|nr:T9SS type A sorting domain-containing protein [Winogradskyella sp.]